MPVAVLWGVTLATVVSVASMLAFNWFFLPPTHTFQLSDAENWLALAVYPRHRRSSSACSRRRRGAARSSRRSGRLEAEADAPQRHDEDRRAPRRLARPALAAHGDRRRRVRARQPGASSSRAPTATSSSRRSAPRPSGSTASSATCSTSRASEAASPRRTRSSGRPTTSSRARSSSSARAASAS